MITLITRYFDSADTARSVKAELVTFERVASRIVHVFDTADGLADTLTAWGTFEDTAQAYAKRLASGGGGAVLMVRAGYKPLGVAKTVRDICARAGAADMGDIVQDVRVQAEAGSGLSILEDHPHFMTKPLDSSRPRSLRVADWPIPLISRRKPYTEALFPRHARMANFPLPLTIRREPFSESLLSSRHAHMANFPIPLLSDRKPYTKSMISRHGRMANFILPLISRRKPYTGSIFPRHYRMANWPFPHLLDGKTGQNALMPGAPRMANFPIRLLSKRKPFTGSIIPRHGRMARFPIPLISHRKPYTKSAIQPHARMANMFLPLVTRRDSTASDGGGTGFSFSKLLGMPTLIRR